MEVHCSVLRLEKEVEVHFDVVHDSIAMNPSMLLKS